MARNFDAFEDAVNALLEPRIVLVLASANRLEAHNLAFRLVRGLAPLYTCAFKELSVDRFSLPSMSAPRVIVASHERETDSTHPHAFDFCKLAATNMVVKIGMPNGNREWVPSPLIIITTNGSEAFTKSRRFRIVNLET